MCMVTYSTTICKLVYLIRALQNLSVIKLEKHGITDFSSTSGYIYHWKMPLFICILNLHVTLNKRKPYHSLLVVPDTISNENRWVIVMWSLHEPLAIVTSYRPIILTLFLWTLLSQRCCQPGTFQSSGSSQLHYSQCFASFSRYNRNWPIIRSALSWFVLPQRHSTRGAGWCIHLRPHNSRPHSCCAAVAAQTTTAQTV